MKKIFTLLAVAAMAITAKAELTVVSLPVDADGKIDLSNDVIVDNDYFSAKLLTSNPTSGANEYKYTTVEGGSDDVSLTNWFELRSSVPSADAPLAPTPEAGRSAVLVTVKKAVTLYSFVRTGNNKKIELYSDAVAMPATRIYVDDNGSNYFWTTSWSNVQPGDYILTESGGTGRLSGFAYEAGAESGIANVIADENAPVEYYNLQGVRVANPEQGFYIKRQGNKVEKVVL